jgi:hypothetical protein
LSTAAPLSSPAPSVTRVPAPAMLTTALFTDPAPVRFSVPAVTVVAPE